MTESMGEEEERWNHKKQSVIDEISNRLITGDLPAKIQAAREIRSIIRNRTSSGKVRAKFGAAGVIQPLVLMLCSQSHDARQVSLLAILNLASRNQRNKEQIVTCGAIPPLVKLLKFQNTTYLRDLATAAILTLSSAPNNKPAISKSGAIPLLIQILSCGTVQGRVDAVTALHNLYTTTTQEPPILLEPSTAPLLINLLKECKKHSNFADKTVALVATISSSPQGMLAITKAEDGILTLVETIEDGSLVSTHHAVSVLLELCMSERSISLLRLTVDGTREAQNKARLLLDLLRETSTEKRVSSSVWKRWFMKWWHGLTGLRKRLKPQRCCCRMWFREVQTRVHLVDPERS